MCRLWKDTRASMPVIVYQPSGTTSIAGGSSGPNSNLCLAVFVLLCINPPLGESRLSRQNFCRIVSLENVEVSRLSVHPVDVQIIYWSLVLLLSWSSSQSCTTDFTQTCILSTRSGHKVQLDYVTATSVFIALLSLALWQQWKNAFTGDLYYPCQLFQTQNRWRCKT